MIEVERLSEDGLTGERWQFRVFSPSYGDDDIKVRLDLYAKLARPSIRHKLRVTSKWDTMDERSYHSNIKRADIPCPESVQAEALAAVKVSLVLPTPTEHKP
jgi:hypothetical protein